MPADNQFDVVHAKTVGQDRYYACAAKVRKEGYYAPGREYFPDGSFRAISTYVKDTSSTDCRSDRKVAAEMCSDCRFPVDHPFLNKMGIAL